MLCDFHANYGRFLAIIKTQRKLIPQQTNNQNDKNILKQNEYHVQV